MECAGVNVERLTFEAADVAGSPLDDRPQVAAQVDRWVRIGGGWTGGLGRSLG